ncbi:MAG: shikimate dehydrogenase [Candidatus Bathyarchaeota archaeon]|nr:shikimate dehydrogenase [Candidatus Bathyarchaeota archaeon]
MNLSGKTAVYGVIGDPVAHSLSPAMQNAAFEALGLNSVFLAFQVPAVKVEFALRGMRGLGICGLNVTMPDKNAVIPHLDEVDETARFLGSVNTILNDSGKLRGFSTDGAGAHRALIENGAELAKKKLVVLGGGGAAKAVAYTLAQEVAELTLLNRTPQKLADLAKAITQKFQTKVTVGSTSPNEIQRSLQDADVLVNATSVGMHPHTAQSLVKPEWLKPTLTVMDIVYNPEETKLAQDAKAAGARVVSGVEMLIYQGAASFEIWTGKPAPVEVMRNAAQNQLKHRASGGDGIGES